MKVTLNGKEFYVDPNKDILFCDSGAYAHQYIKTEFRIYPLTRKEFEDFKNQFDITYKAGTYNTQATFQLKETVCVKYYCYNKMGDNNIVITRYLTKPDDYYYKLCRDNGGRYLGAIQCMSLEPDDKIIIEHLKESTIDYIQSLIANCEKDLSNLQNRLAEAENDWVIKNGWEEIKL